MIFYNLLTWIDACYSDFSVAWVLNLRFSSPTVPQNWDILLTQSWIIRFPNLSGILPVNWTYFERDECSTYCWSSGIFTTSQLPLEDGLKTENIRSQLQLWGRKMPLWCQGSEVRMDGWGPLNGNRNSNNKPWLQNSISEHAECPTRSRVY